MNQAAEDPLGWNGDLSLSARVIPPRALLEVTQLLGQRPTRDFSGWHDDAPVNALSTAVLRALRLIKPESVLLGPVRVRPDNPFLFFLERTRPSPQSESQGGDWYILTPEDTDDLQALYSILMLPPSEPRLSLALTRFDDTYMRARSEDRLIDQWIALEALFASDIRQELKYRAALRIAHFVGAHTQHQERAELFEDMGNSYDFRSSVVHGADLDTETKRLRKGEPKQSLRTLMPHIEAKTGAVLRASLKQSLIQGAAPDLNSLDLIALERAR